MHDRRVEPGLRRTRAGTPSSAPAGRPGSGRTRRSTGPAWSAPPGAACLSRRMASIVSMPSRRVSSWPVAIGNVRQSTRTSRGGIPWLSRRSVMSRSATRTFQSAVRAWPSSSMVRATTAAPYSLTERHDPGEPRAGPVAVLVVDRVDDRSAAEHLQARLQDRRLGGVQHDRQGGRGRQPAGQLAHVGDAVAADVVDAQVEQVRRRRGSAPGRSRRTAPSPGPASPPGTPWSRWRWSAHRSTGRTCPAGTARDWYSDAAAAS